jgi:hypothetical protein
MKSRSIKTSLLALSLLAGSAGLPLAAFADTGTTAATHTAMTGTYDGFDKFKDTTGRPASGWQYLHFPANGNG